MNKPLLLAILFFLPFLSCAKKPVDYDLDDVDIRRVLEEVKERDGDVKSVKGLATVRIRTTDRVISFKQVTIAESPNLLHLEALDPLGRTAAVIISDGERIYLTFSGQTQVFDSLQEFDLSFLYPGLHAKVGIDSLVNLLLGSPAQKIDYDETEAYLGKSPENLVLYFFSRGEQESVLWINPINYAIEKARVNLGGGKSAVSEFGDFIKTDSGSPFPRTMELKLGGSTISVKYDDDVEINGEIDENLFKPLEPVAEKTGCRMQDT